MAHVRKFILDNGNLTDEYLEKFKAKHAAVIPVNATDEVIRIGLNDAIVDKAITFARDNIIMQFNNALAIIHNPAPNLKPTFSMPHFVEVCLNIADYNLMVLIDEFPHMLSYAKEVENELSSIWINSSSLLIPFMDGSSVENTPNPYDLFQDLNLKVFKIKSDKSLLAKIDNGADNVYLNDLMNTIEYLKNKLHYCQPPTTAQPNINETYKHIPKTLESLFKDKRIYHALIDFMCLENLVAKGNGNLIWKGYRKGALYEVSAFHEALHIADLLINKATNDAELISLARNTFFRYTAVERTMNNKKSLPRKITQYGEMLIRFRKSYSNIP